MGKVASHRRRSVPWFGLLVFVLAFAGVPLAIANNALGLNISGTITCETGHPVVAAQVIADRPFPGRSEIALRPDPAPHSGHHATINYWLAFGGSYKVKVRCGPGPDDKPGYTAQSQALQSDWIALECKFHSRGQPEATCRDRFNF